MKRKLFKSLLAVALICTGSNAWADETTVTYDFTSYSARTLSKSETRAFNANSVDHYYASNLPEVFNRFAFQFAGTFSIDAAGLYAERTKGDHVGIVGLAAGDKVTIYFSQGAIMVRGAVPTWAGITSDWTNYTSGTELSITAAGNLSFQAKTSCKISSIVIKTQIEETMTAPSISSESSANGRTVTITGGESNLLSGVTTYYTTDGTDPTASSTLYTAPFEVTSSTTVKAISISNSSAETESAIATQDIDLDQVDAPTATLTAVDGVNRTISFACTTDGATLYYSTDNGANYTEGSSLVISENTAIIVKATKGSAEAYSDVYNFEAGTAIVLNTPTWVKTGYSEGVSTVTLSSDQSGLLLSPVAAIYYKINGGAATEYTSAISVNDGDVLTYYAAAVGYSNSAEGSVTAQAPNNAPTMWSENYAGVVSANNNLSLAGEDNYKKIYYNEGADLVSSFLLANNINSGSNYMMYRPSGLYPVSGWNLAINGLKSGDYVIINGVYGNGAFAIRSGAVNMTADTWNTIAGSKYCYTVNEDGQVRFTMERYGYLTSIEVKRASENLTVSSYGWATLFTPCALDFSGVTGLTAYTATCDGTTVKLTPVTSVPANTGVVLKGDADDYSIPTIASSSTAKGSLAGSATKATAFDAVDGKTLYVLAYDKDRDVVQFQPVTEGTIAAGKAYLALTTPSSGVKALNVAFGTATGINAVESARQDGMMFNLAGQRVSMPARGLYIKNGKKVVVK